VGGVLGFCQWRVLRRWVRDAGWWIPASLLAWAAGGAVYWAVYRIMGGTLQDASEPWPGREVYVRASVSGYIAGGIVVGVVTGLTLKYLLARSNKESYSAPEPEPEPAKESSVS